MEDTNYHEIVNNILDNEIDYNIDDIEGLKKYYLRNRKNTLKREHKKNKSKKLITGVFFGSVILIPSLNGFINKYPIPIRLAYTIATGAVVGYSVNKIYNYYINKKVDKKINNYIEDNKKEKTFVKKLDNKF